MAKQRAEAAAAAGLGPGGMPLPGSGLSGADKELLLRHIESLREVGLAGMPFTWADLLKQWLRALCCLHLRAVAMKYRMQPVRFYGIDVTHHGMQARQEAEHMRQECRRLEGELALSTHQVRLQCAHRHATAV